MFSKNLSKGRITPISRIILFNRAQRAARREKTTLRALTEEGLRLVLAKEKEKINCHRW